MAAVLPYNFFKASEHVSDDLLVCVLPDLFAQLNYPLSYIRSVVLVRKNLFFKCHLKKSPGF